MQNFIFPILVGVFGGMVRALVGMAKYFKTAKNERKIRWAYLGFSLVVSALVGGVAGALAQGDLRVSLLAGYAGTDFLEGLYKVSKKQAGAS